MRGFWGGVIATALASVLAGIILWYGTDWAQTWKASRAQVLQFQSAYPGQNLIIDKSVLSSMAKLESGDVISTIRFENSGSEELDNLDLTLRSGSLIKDAGILFSQPSDADEPKITLKDNDATFSYQLLRRGEGATVWFVTNSLFGTKITSSRKGLVLDEIPVWRSYQSNEGFPTWTFFLGGFIIFILGALASEFGNRSMLRKIGFDPDEVAKAYTDALKKK